MKKLIILLFVLILACSFVLAQGIHEPGTGIENPEIKEAGQGTGQGLDNGTPEPTLINEQIQQQERTQLMDGSGNGQRQRLQIGSYTGPEGKQMQIHQQANNQLRLEVGGFSANCPICGNMTQEQFENRTILYAGLSNGRNAEIKVMPDTASQTALQKLRLRNCNENCTIELKEVGSGNQTRAAYEMRTQRNSRVLGMFKARMNVQAQVDAESGEVIRTGKPWWAFLATEPEE